MEDQTSNLSMIKEQLKEKLDQITDWQEWSDMEESLFKLGEWKEADIETMEVWGQRETIVLDGHEWRPFVSPYDIDREILYLYEMASWYIFEKLEPEAQADNLPKNKIGK